MIARTSDCRSRNFASKVNPSITGMLMSSSKSSISGSSAEHRERLLAVMGEAESEFLGADLAAEALPDQQFEIRLVVDREDLAGVMERLSRERVRQRSCNFARCSGSGGSRTAS